MLYVAIKITLITMKQTDYLLKTNSLIQSYFTLESWSYLFWCPIFIIIIIYFSLSDVWGSFIYLWMLINDFQELVVDDASEEPTSPHNGAPSPRENGLDKLQPKKEHPPHSPRYTF